MPQALINQTCSMISSSSLVLILSFLPWLLNISYIRAILLKSPYCAPKIKYSTYCSHLMLQNPVMCYNITPFLIKLFNLSVSLGQLPSQWKQFLIVHISSWWLFWCLTLSATSIEHWSSDNHLQLNALKCKYMTITIGKEPYYSTPCPYFEE